MYFKMCFVLIICHSIDTTILAIVDIPIYVSKKFISADGGLKRLVWMPKELKDAMADKLKKRCEEEGVPDLFDKIADETVAEDSENLLKFLKEKNHPALTMPPLM